MPHMKLAVLGSVSFCFCFSFYGAVACSSDTPPAPATGAGAGGGGMSGSVGGVNGGGASGSTAQAGGTGGVLPSAGTGGTPGASGTASTGGASGGTATGGGTGSSAGSGGSAGTGGGAGAGQGGGTAVTAGCANHNYPLCLDFETPIDKAIWTGGTDAAVSTADKAHGERSYHAYKDAGVLQTTKFNGITNVMWGRFYLKMSPGAPGGHGNIVGAYQGGEWYELGWQFNGLMGVWHFGGGENPLRSHPDIVDKWYCVELLFDGTTMEMPKWWVDGKEAEYYMGEPNNRKPSLINQFDKLTVGFTAYAGLGLAKEPYGNSNPPVLTDMWLDDIAFDTKRIGCIAP